MQPSEPSTPVLGNNQALREFSEQLGASDRRPIESFIGAAPAAERTDLLRELVLREYAHLWANGELPVLMDYQNRFPDDKDLIAMVCGKFAEKGTVPHALIEECGSGAFGTVFRAFETNLQRQVAVKVLKAWCFSSGAASSRFEQEIQRLASIEHSGVVRVYGAYRFPNNGPRYLVMQYIDGKSLREVIDDAPKGIDPTEAAEKMAAIADAIEFVHRCSQKHQALVHRDLKPENILIDLDGNPFVTDFGLAAAAADLHEHSVGAAGTVAYASPEQVRGFEGRPAQIDTRSDIWSLGVVLYELLTGNKPFIASRRDDLFEAIERYEPTAPKDLNTELPARLDEIVRKCLRKDPNDRFQSAADLARELREWVLSSRASQTVAAQLVNPRSPMVCDFIGREREAAFVRELLRKEGTEIPAIKGMGGVGKTWFAYKVASTVAELFPDGQVFVDLEGTSDLPVSPARAMTRIIRAVQPTGHRLPESESDLLPIYLRVLEKKRVLIVLDNAKDETQVRSLSAAPFPVRFIITSRNTIGLDRSTPVPLHEFDLTEAIRLMRAVIKDRVQATDDELAHVARLCGNLPLALQVAATFLRLHQNLSLKAYIKELEDDSSRLRWLGRTSESRDVERVLEVSAVHLARENPQLALQWHLLSLFGRRFRCLHAAAIFGLKENGRPDRRAALRALTELLDQSLLQYHKEDGQYEMHDLFRIISRVISSHCSIDPDTLKDRVRNAKLSFAVYQCMLLREIEWLHYGGPAAATSWLLHRDFERESDWFVTAYEWARSYAGDSEAAFICCQLAAAAGEMSSDHLGSHLIGQWIDFALPHARKLDDKRPHAAMLARLASSRVIAEDFAEAARLATLALRLARASKSAVDINKARITLGEAWFALGKTEPAAKLFALVEADARINRDPRARAYALIGLSKTSAKKGERQAADQYLHRGAEILERELGDSVALLYKRGYATQSHVTLGETKDEEYYGSVLKHARATCNTRLVRDTLRHLACVYFLKRDYAKSLECAEEGLAMASALGETDQIAGALWDVAIAHHGLGSVDKAIQHGRRAIDMLAGTGHPSYGKLCQLLDGWRRSQ